MSSMIIKTATIDDALIVAQLHVSIWQLTYQGLAPQAAYEGLTVERRLAYWQEVLNSVDNSSQVILAVVDNQVAGFCHYGQPNNPVMAGYGEIKVLYVDPSFKRQGIGKKLLRQAAIDLRERGYSRAALGVVVGNDPAINFYLSLGGQLINQYTDPGPLWKSENHVCAWEDLGVLIG